VNYRLGTTHSIYANIGGGVEAPAGNETDPASTFGQDTVTALNPLLDPIYSTTYEVGTKRVIPLAGSVLSAFTYDVALYNTRVTNEIVPYRGGRFYFTAGKADRKGAEFQAALGGDNELEITGSLTLSRNKYRDYVVDSVHYGRPARFADYSGNDIAGVPPVFYTVSAGRGIGSGVPLHLQVTMRGVGDYFVDDANTVEVPSYNIFSATASTGSGLRVGALNVKAFVSVENLANERYIGSAFVNPDVVNEVPVAFEAGSARNLLFSLKIERARDR
jgi:outer membrane receptor for monomeric catechols